MNPIEVLLLYTPLVQFIVLYGLLYRHELSRLAHPLKEKTDSRAWVEAFEQLGLAELGQKVRSGPRVRKYVLEMVLPTALLATRRRPKVEPVVCSTSFATDINERH